MAPHLSHLPVILQNWLSLVFIRLQSSGHRFGRVIISLRQRLTRDIIKPLQWTQRIQHTHTHWGQGPLIVNTLNEVAYMSLIFFYRMCKYFLHTVDITHTVVQGESNKPSLLFFSSLRCLLQIVPKADQFCVLQCNG